MHKKTIIIFVFLALIAYNNLFSQALAIDDANPNETEDILDSSFNRSDPNQTEGENDLYQDYTTGERLGIGVLNIFGGIGSITRGGRTGWLVTGIQGVGLLSILGGVIYGVMNVPPTASPSPGSNAVNEEHHQYNGSTDLRIGLITAGSIAIGTGIVVGFIIPFFHHRAQIGNTVSEVTHNSFPLNFDLVSSNGRSINGFSVSYNIRF